MRYTLFISAITFVITLSCYSLSLGSLGNTDISEVTGGASDEQTIPGILNYVDDKYYEEYEPTLVADQSGKTGARKRKKVPSDWPKAPSCKKIYSQVLSATGGNKARANCYMGLFFMETTCNPTLSQAAGNAGNAHAAYGLCSLEKSAGVRKSNNRGPDCNNIQSIVNQARCCRAIMRKTPNYFGPYNRREVAQCG